MRRTMVLTLPGNSTKEQVFTHDQTQPAQPPVEWPGLPFDEDPLVGGAPTLADPKPFKITGGR